MLKMAPGLGLLITALCVTSALGGPVDDPGEMVARMAKVGLCASPSFSPDGRRIAFVCDIGGLPQVWIVAAEGGWPEPVTALDDPIGSVLWSPAGDRVAFTLAPGGGIDRKSVV